jgi:hypothetical protein
MTSNQRDKNEESLWRVRHENALGQSYLSYSVFPFVTLNVVQVRLNVVLFVFFGRNDFLGLIISLSRCFF